MNQNDLFYQDMLKLLDQDEDDYDNMCLIDGQVLDENHLELKCGHKFNYLSLLKEVKVQKRKNYLETQKLKKWTIKCPYCRSVHSGVLPYLSNVFPTKIKGVNWPPSKVFKFKSCTYTLKSGKRKGEMCGKACINDFCKIHMKKIKVENNFKTCTAIIKSGKRKGQICGCKSKNNTSFCGRHIQKKII